MVPANFESFGMDADVRRLLLTQEVETDVTQHGEVFVGMTEPNS